MRTTAGIIKLERLDIENFMGWEQLSILAEGKHFLCRAPNGFGKTSAFQAFLTLVTGKSSKKIPDPIHHGATKAKIVGTFSERDEVDTSITIGEYVIERHITKSTNRLILRKNGEEVKSAQTLLDGFVSTITQNPDDFLSMRPQDQLDMYLQVGNVLPPVEAVREITGETISPEDDERAYSYMIRICGDKDSIYWNKRLEANRELLASEGAVKKQLEVIAKLPEPADVPPLAELLKRQAELTAEQGKHTRAATLASGTRAKHKDYVNRLNERKAQEQTQAKAMDELQASIAIMQAKLDEMSKSHVEVLKKIQDGTKAVADVEKQLELETAEAEKYPDRTSDIEALHKQMESANSQQEREIERKVANDTLVKLEGDVDRFKRKHKKFETIMEKLRELRKSLVDNVRIGVDGLEVLENQIYVNGTIWEQVNKSKKLLVACAVAMKTDCTIRILRIDDAERYDAKTMKMVYELADENNFQVMMAAVAADGEGEMMIEFTEPRAA